MTWWHAVILGLVEGITEYLPISSTGHLILASAALGLNSPESKRAIDDFNIIIQGGAILAVAGLYWPRVKQICKGLIGRDNAGTALFVNLLIAFLPAAVLGKLMHDWIESMLFFPIPVTTALAVGGLFMIWLQARRDGRLGLAPISRTTIEEITPRQALFIGCLQCVALWPGTSRSMMTIAGGYMVGLPAAAAAEFSFLLGLPTLTAATLYSLYKNLSHAKSESAATGHHVANLFESLGAVNCLIGIVVAAISAAIAIKWLVGFLSRKGLTAFGIYRLILAAFLTILIARGAVTIAPKDKDAPKTPPVPAIRSPK
ncbi:MAG: undecaprenyl-diphosphate phosphatase [Planctomycetota bacterium]